MLQKQVLLLQGDIRFYSRGRGVELVNIVLSQMHRSCSSPRAATCEKGIAPLGQGGCRVSCVAAGTQQ